MKTLLYSEVVQRPRPDSMPKPGILKRIFLKCLYLVPEQDSEDSWHAVQQGTYARAHPGRFTDVFSHAQVESEAFSLRAGKRGLSPRKRIVGLDGRKCDWPDGSKEKGDDCREPDEEPSGFHRSAGYLGDARQARGANPWMILCNARLSFQRQHP